MIKNILFDMGGIILILDSAESFRRFAGLGLNSEEYMGVYGQKDFFLDLESGKIDAAEFCRRLAETCGKKSISYEQAQNCWLGFIKEAPLDRLHDLLKLKDNYHLGLLSNTNPFMMDYIDSPRLSSEGKPISAYFDSLFLSYRMGICKPDPKIFEMALVADGMKADETLFIDDSMKNIRAAESVGMRTLHVPTNEDWMTPLQALLAEQAVTR